jgi:aspartate/methionine/tyrosine aminotransferase
LPFDTVISANIGNPQQLDQKPITFFRQVASLMENPQLLEHEDVLTGPLGYKTDVLERAKWLLSEVNSVGAYSQSMGAPAIRQSVANFIESMYDAWNLACYTDHKLQDEMAIQLTQTLSTSPLVPLPASMPYFP